MRLWYNSDKESMYVVFVMNELLLHLANKIYTGKSYSSSSISQSFLSIACLSDEFEKDPKFNEKPNVEYQKTAPNSGFWKWFIL